MKSRSAPGSSTPTSRRTEGRPSFLFSAVAIAAIPLGLAYVIVAFTARNPLLRIALRCAPVVPFAVWTLWFDRSRPLQQQPLLTRVAGRLVLFIAVMLFVVALLGLALNWLYDPSRIV